MPSWQCPPCPTPIKSGGKCAQDHITKLEYGQLYCADQISSQFKTKCGHVHWVTFGKVLVASVPSVGKTKWAIGHLWFRSPQIFKFILIEAAAVGIIWIRSGLQCWGMVRTILADRSIKVKIGLISTLCNIQFGSVQNENQIGFCS